MTLPYMQITPCIEYRVSYRTYVRAPPFFYIGMDPIFGESLS